MMRKTILFAVGGIMLSGCSNAIDDAEERYRIVEAHGSPAEKCRAAREVANAYLDAKREADYRIKDLHADIQCQNVQLARQLGDAVD